jgi:hypothetical protein
MWKLQMRGARGSPFTDLGSYDSINDAARVILETENTPLERGFFSVFMPTLLACFSPLTKMYCSVSITKQLHATMC